MATKFVHADATILKMLPLAQRIGLVSELDEIEAKHGIEPSPGKEKHDKNNTVFFYIVENDNKDGIMYVPYEQFKTLFSIVDGEERVVTADKKFSFRIPMENDLGKKLYTAIDIERIKNNKNKNYIADLKELLPFVQSMCLVADMPSWILNHPDVGPDPEILEKKDDFVALNLKKGEDIGISYATIAQIKSIFTMLSVIKGVPYIATADCKIQIPIPLESSLGKKFYDELTVQRLQATMKIKMHIPPEHQGKCCICFGGIILDSAESFEKAQELAKTKYPSLATRIIIPPTCGGIVATFCGDSEDKLGTSTPVSEQSAPATPILETPLVD
ncbi:MAG: hypothetical protein Edafosvirus19_23 [Edafosvirus sp.]|uniref:Uncharacterized protein n=1 Tax=Edafosvirus sp. TaxID=2487765 RepID=A0A3G4ZUL7_9VIRU|nr:MAG: hypothetical protein Edafosvirus19_23 [Edafosvirus sp.]